MKVISYLLLFLFIIPIVASFPSVRQELKDTTLKLDITGTPPFWINIRDDTNIGKDGGYLWAKTSINKFTYDLGFANNPSKKFYYGIKDSSWSSINSIDLNHASNNETPDNGTQENCQDQNGKLCLDYQVCDGIVLSAADTNRCCRGTCKLPKSFSYGNRHGQNWLTPSKNQGPYNTCGYFSMISAIEAKINLYYNQQLDLDLAEQFIISCQHPGNLHDRKDMDILNECLLSKDYGYLGGSGCLIYKFGVTDEQCSPYLGMYLECNSSMACSDWKNRLWAPTNVVEYSRYGSSTYPVKRIESMDDLKRVLIEEGPFPFAREAHSVLFVGYYEKNGTTIMLDKDNYNYSGLDSSEIQFSEIMNFEIFSGPFIPPENDSFWPNGFKNEIKCVDDDNDGFCNWGISKDMPATCPSYCKSEKDWDDSDPNIKVLGIY